MLTLFLVWGSSQVDAAERTFNRDIRPILSANCFACHGTDAKHRKADLRLDEAAAAYADHDGTVAIKPGDLANSEAWQRIISDDPELMMPPPSSKKALTTEQKQILREWIEQGARYQKHWAFEAPVKPPVPAVKKAGWARNEIDQFLLARIEQEGLEPRPEADRPTLIRRVAFALTGLPPTPKEVTEFEADQSPQAYEVMVDRYLSSPRHGEEMARHWLDVARYADTHGLHLDNERTMWAYRDWVVKAFNENKPFSEFTIDQLAGDLLPNPTRDQRIATGFNRCNVTTSEGGSIEAEFVYRYAVDRTSTMVQAWMGLTGGCAVCHDHKFDPLSAREFYSLYAFFYSAGDPAMDRNANNTDPFFKLTTEEQAQAIGVAQATEADAKKLLEVAAGRVMYKDPAEPPAAAASTDAPKPEPAKIEKITVEDVWLDDAFPLGARVACTSRNASIWVTDADAPMGKRALRQAFASNYQDKFENWIQPLVLPENPKVSIFVKTDTYETPNALLVELTTASGSRRAIWGDPQHYGAKKTDKNWMGEMPEAGRWARLELTADKLDLKPGDAVRGIALAQFGGIAWWDGLTVAGEVQPTTDPRSSFLAWWKDRTGKPTDGIPGEIAEALKAGPDKIPAPELKDKLLRYFLAYIARPTEPELVERKNAWLTAQTARMALEDAIPGTLVFKELEKPREAFVMVRGQYDKPGEKVEPGVPAIFPALQKAAAESRASRLDLANWLLSAEHPLTARVAVNRYWQQLFGTGLVKTSYDFGTQGEPPSHPELLDWLAVTYRENGWDTKALVKMLVTSAAFRQDTHLTPELLRRDPENRLYARGPRFRLDAEQIRDNSLYVSGLMNLKMGGPGVKSYQPPNIWEPVGYSDSNTRFYLQDHGDSLYRRSIYAFLKRTAPPPFMSNFDAPNREQLCAMRERSNTPLQALQLMNDTQQFEAARALGERIITEGGATPDERVRFAFRVVLSRLPEPEELEVVKQVLAQYTNRYQTDIDAARKVVGVGESKPKTELVAADPAVAELAAHTLLANLVLNLDETVMRN